MVELKTASPQTRGRAKWLGLTLPEDCTEALAKTEIFNAALPPSIVKMANRLGLDTQGYSFGAVWPELKAQRSQVEADLLESASWEVGKWLTWEDQIFLIIALGFNASVKRSTIRLQALGKPQPLVVKKGKVHEIRGITIPLTRRTRTAFPFDLIDASIISFDSLQLY